MSRQTPMYGSAWFDAHERGVVASAERVVPLLATWLRPAAVVDVGCGRGAWLSVWRRHGVDDVLGMDGPWVRAEELLIPAERFRAVDLEQPLDAPRRFDLALSLEVAEHLAPATGRQFVAGLVTLAPVVVFSAAVPGQGGTGHLNERWPAEWAALFAAHGYVAVDALRPRIWNDAAVEGYYRQNLLVFREAGALADHPVLGDAAGARPDGVPADGWPLPLIHPQIFESRPFLRDIPRIVGDRLRDAARARARRR